MARKKKKSKKSASRSKNHRKEVMGLLLVALGIFFFVCIFTDASGIVGKSTSRLLTGLFGILAYPLPFLVIAWGVYSIIMNQERMPWHTLLLYASVALSVMALVHLIFIRQYDRSSLLAFMNSSYDLGVTHLKGGGYIPALLVYPAVKYIGTPGAIILFVTYLLVVAVIKTRLSLKTVSDNIGQTINEHVIQPIEKQRVSRQLFMDDLSAQKRLPGEDMEEPNVLNRNVFRGSGVNMTDLSQMPFEKSSADVSPFSPEDEPFGKRTGKGNVLPMDKHQNTQEHETPRTKQMVPAAPPVQQRAQEIPAEYIVPDEYQFPAISFLNENKQRRNSQEADIECQQNAKRLEETLLSFGIRATVNNITRGPVITRFELQPAPGIKISRIINLSNDIAMSMAAPGVRIEAPIPGKNAIGIEVPNQNTSMVTLRDVLDHPAFRSAASKLSFCLGQDIAGKNMITDLAKMPHMLIAGATGSGKSVCINCLIMSLLYKATPEEVRMIMIDPKVVELSVYNGIPHLLMPVVTDPAKAAGALHWAVKEMTRRYQLFADRKARDIKRYNEIVAETKEGELLSQIVIIIDELADLMMVAPKDVEDGICRLAQMARAAGMHLVIATQRPSVDVITGVIKANIPSRIAFAVSSQIDSRTILDMGGAEKLLGRGDMLFDPSGSPKPIRIQGAYVSEEEVEKIVEHLRKDDEDIQYNEDMLQEVENYDVKRGGSKDDKEEEESGEVHRRLDPLLRDAIEVVFEQNQASISMVQRRLRVGYARAARLIDEMELLGIVSGNSGSKPRQIIKSRSETLAILDGETEV